MKTKVFQIESFDSEQLENLLTKVVKHCFKEHLPKEALQNESETKLVNIKEMAAILGKSVATIHAYKKKQWIPYKKIGRSLFFSPDEVLAAMRIF